MKSNKFDNNEMEKLSQSFSNFQQDPATWGESKWDSNLGDPLLIWEWAEVENRIDLMSSIAEGVVAYVLAKANNDRERNEKRQYWISKIERLAEDTNSIGQAKFNARFLEALLYLDPAGYRDTEQLGKIISLYRELGQQEKIVFYSYRKAVALNALLMNDKLISNESEVWKLLIDVYSISREMNFLKGIVLALLSLGDYLGQKNKDELALKFLYQAKLFTSKANTKFGISVIEEFRNIKNRSNIPANKYEVDKDPDVLIEEFLAEIDK